MKIKISIALFLAFCSVLAGHSNAAQAKKDSLEIITPKFQPSASHIPSLVQWKELKHPKIALVLSGGGARGIAAIGVLKVFERNHIPIDLIVGNSIGSIVGGLYASGYSPARLQTVVDTTNWDDILSYGDQARREDMFLDKKIARDKSVLVLRFNGLSPVIPSAFSSGQHLTNYINTLTLQSIYHPDPSFDDLRIPFRAVATDLITGKRVIIDHGDLTSALRASMTVPLLFTAVNRDTMQLLDGGLVGNLPVEVAIQEKADIIIAVDMTGTLRTREQLTAPWEIADQITTIMMQEANEISKKKADLVIAPKLGNRLSTDFTKLDTLVKIGEDAAESALPLVKKLVQRKTTAVPADTVLYKNCKVEADDAAAGTAQEIRIKEFQQVPSHTRGDIGALLRDFYATGAYDTVEARVQELQDSTLIRLNLVRYPSLDSVRFSGNRCLSSDTLLTLFQPLLHKPINAKYSAAALEGIIQKYRNAGYSLARIMHTQYNPSLHEASITIDEGIIGKIDVSGTTKVRDWVVRREIPMKAGQPFILDKAMKGIGNLDATNYFDQIILTLHHEGPGKEENAVVIQAHERGTDLIRFGLRIDNERNIQPSIDIRDEDFLGAGGEIGFMAAGGSRNQSYIGEIRATRIFNTYLTFAVQGYSFNTDINVYDNGVQNNPDRFERDRVGEYQQIRNGGTISFGTQLDRLGSFTLQERLEHINVSNIFNNAITNQSYDLSAFRVGTYIDTQDKFPYPHSGEVFDFYYESALTDIGSSVGYTKMYMSYDKYLTIFNDHTFHPRFALGVADELLPISEQFTFGGQNNFFGYNEDDSHGCQLLTASLEYRYKLPVVILFDTYFKARYDLGAIWLKTEEMKLSDFSHGLGVSLAFDTPIGPAEFSVGRAFFIQSTLEHLVSWGPYMFAFSIGYPIIGVN